MTTRQLPPQRTKTIGNGCIATLILWAIGALLMMLIFVILHRIFPAIPTIGFLAGAGLIFVLWLLKRILA